MCFSVLIINLPSGDFSESWSCSQTVRQYNANYNTTKGSLESHTSSYKNMCIESQIIVSGVSFGKYKN